MSSFRILRISLWLIAICAFMYISAQLSVVTERLAGPILMFTSAWLIALVIDPVFVVLSNIRIPRVWSVPLVYALLISVIVVVIIAVIPVIYNQIDGFVQNIPAGVALARQSLIALQRQFERFGIQSDMQSFFRSEVLLDQFGMFGPTALQQSIGVAGGIAQVLFDVVVVLMLSFYMALDGQALFRKFVMLCPANWRDEVETFGRIMTQTFGGFMRTQLFSSLVYSCVNAIVMMLFGLPSITLATLIVAVALMIPVVGGVVALIPPVLILVLNQPQSIGVYLVTMVIVQQILFNIVLPRMMGKVVGLHPLLVFAALLIGSAVAGPWGVLLGIPLAGVVASITNYVYVRHPVATDNP